MLPEQTILSIINDKMFENQKISESMYEKIQKDILIYHPFMTADKKNRIDKSGNSCYNRSVM